MSTRTADTDEKSVEQQAGEDLLYEEAEGIA